VLEIAPEPQVTRAATVPTAAVGSPRTAGYQLTRLTSLRAFGAFVVFLYHADKWGVKGLPGGYSAVGYVGVAFFFFLSGFVLAWGTRPGLPARTFYRRRFARVWPSHFVMLLVAAVVPVVQVARNWQIAIPNALLVQAWFRHSDTVIYGMDAPSWSLSAEAFFYAVFPFAVLFVNRIPRRLAWALVALGLVAEYLATVHNAGQAYHVPVLRLPEFLLGLVAGLAFRNGWRPRVPFWLAGVLVVIGMVITVRLPIAYGDTVLALPFLSVILAAARRDVEGRPGWLRQRWLVFAGEASFAFYLVHELAIVNLKDRLTVHHSVNLVLIFLAAAAGAVLLHLAVERPCNRLLRGGRSSSVAPAAPAS
jgi:peptidoglycan/LPS O-acetylase OafA/YrhL